jgi:transcriptional regulator with AAA-type ATPase domain
MPMPWIPHLMVLDDDPRVLESLIPAFAQELGRSLAQSATVGPALRRGDASDERSRSPVSVKISAHGFETSRLALYRNRSPFQVHLHLVCEQGGRFDRARRLLNEQLFAAVISDQRFADDATSQRAGQLFVREAERVHPELQGLLYSAYPRPADFPADRFIRKGPEQGPGGLVEATTRAIERHLADPAVNAFASAIAEQGLIYQSDAFGSTLAQLFGLARLLGTTAPPVTTAGRQRRPLPCLLLDGESGTGKRGLAAVFHAATDRRPEPVAVASCNELTNETLLRSILFGHKRGAFTDARDDRRGLVTAAGQGMLLLDDFHRLSPSCSAVLHSFLEDGEFARLGEEEVRKHADCLVVLTVETEPWLERRRSGELPLAFLARVERLPLTVPPLRDRPEDIASQARWLARSLARELKVDVELDEDAIAHLCVYPFADSNSRELRNLIEQAFYRHYRETDTLTWEQIAPPSSAVAPPRATPSAPQGSSSAPRANSSEPPHQVLNDWQRRLRTLAAKILARGDDMSPEDARRRIDDLFDHSLPSVWVVAEASRQSPDRPSPIPLPVWEDVWRCFAVSWLGGPSPAEKVLGIPANTLRQWINDREAK